MLVGDKNIIPPPFELWIPDFTDFAQPRKPDGSCYTDAYDYDDYLDWLVNHLDTHRLPLAPHQREIVSAPDIADWTASYLGLFLGTAAISAYYFLGEPQFDYPADFLSDPRAERVCDPETVEIDTLLMSIDYDQPEDGQWALTLEQFLLFDYMCQEARREYEFGKALLPPGTEIFNDIGWRPLLKVAISRTDVWSEKREALRRFHEEFGYLCQK